MSLAGLAADLLKSGMDVVRSDVDRVTTALTTSGVMNLQPGAIGPGGEEVAGVGGGGAAGGTTSIRDIGDLPLLAAFEAYRSEEGNELRMKLEDKCVVFEGRSVEPAHEMNVEQDSEHVEGFKYVPLDFPDGTWVECAVLMEVDEDDGGEGDSTGGETTGGETTGGETTGGNGSEDATGARLTYVIREEGSRTGESSGFKVVAKARILRVGAGENGNPVQLHKGVLTLSSPKSVRDGPFAPVYDTDGDDPEVVTGFVDCYYMEAGITRLLSEQSIPVATGFVALRVGASTSGSGSSGSGSSGSGSSGSGSSGSGSSGSGSSGSGAVGTADLQGYATLAALQAAQRDVHYFIVPLYKVRESKIVLDLRNIPHTYISEVLP